MLRNVQWRRFSLVIAILGALLLAVFSVILGSLSATASVASVIDDGSNSSGWANDVHLKSGSGNPGDTFSFGKNDVISHSFGSSGADFSGSTIKFDIYFNASTDYLGVWWGQGPAVGSGIANALYMGPAGNPNSASGWMAGKIGLVPNMTGPCIYYCVSGSVTSEYSWDVARWYTVEVKVAAHSTSYYVDGQLIQTITTALPSSNYVTLGGDDRNGWGFSDGVYVDNIAITPAPYRTVTYEVSGSQSPAPIQPDVLEGDNFIVADAVSKDMYDFAGWSDGDTVYQSGDTYTVGATGITLSATWVKKTYPLDFDSAGGSSVTSTTFNNIDVFVEPTPPTRAGFTFYGWSKTSNGSVLGSQEVFTETSLVTLHALWSSNEIEVQFDANGGSAISAVTIELGTSVLTPPADPVRAGYTFDGWKSSPNASIVSFPYLPVLTTGNPAAVAAAALTDDGSYVNVGRWNADTWYGPQRPQNHPRDVVTFKDGLKYVAIRESNNSVLLNPERPDGYYLIPLATSTTLIASWSPTSHQVTYFLAGGESAAPTQANVVTDDSFTIASTAIRPGYVFDGWSDGAALYPAGAVYYVGIADVSLTAQWSVITHKVTYALAGGTSGLPTQADTATDGLFSVADAPSRSGYTFNGWSDGSATFQAGDQYIVSAEDVTLTAIWTQNPSCLINFLAGGGSGVLPNTVPATLLIGESLVLPANPFTKSGFDFAGWSDGAIVRPAGAQVVIEASNLNFVAVWVEKPIVVTHGKRSYTLPGFKFEKSVVSKAMFAKLRVWLNSNSDVVEVTCTGYTGFNQNKLTPAQLARLGKDRAVHVCYYLKKLRPSLLVKIAKPVASNSKNAAMRRVVILGNY
jgi:uncharacterized repeat protein (TIGR02543 family)